MMITFIAIVFGVVIVGAWVLAFLFGFYSGHKFGIKHAAEIIEKEYPELTGKIKK